MKNIYIILFCVFFVNKSHAQKQLSLNDVILLAKTNSIKSKEIESRYQNSYWKYFSYKRTFLPSLVFNGVLPQFTQDISLIPQDDGSETFVNRNIISNSAGLKINQIVPITGGQISIKSDLKNIILSNDNQLTTYLSKPVEFTYSQNIFGFNEFKWYRKVEPLYFDKAKLKKTEEIEDLSEISVVKYFKLLKLQLDVKNAETNLLNNDTIYKIGRARYSYGGISEDELLNLELTLLNSKFSFEQKKLNLELSLQELTTFLGYSSEENFELVLDTVIPDFDVPYNQALNYANIYYSKFIDHKTRILEKKKAIAKAKSESGFNFDLYASYGLTQTADNITDVYQNAQNQEMFILGLNVPILQWGTGRGKIKQAQEKLELEKSIIEQEKIDFIQDVYITVKEFDLNRKQLKIKKKANVVASKAFEVAKQRYLIGNIPITNLLDAQVSKDNALLSYISAYETFWKSYYRIRKITHYDFESKKIIIN